MNRGVFKNPYPQNKLIGSEDIDRKPVYSQKLLPAE